MIRDIPLSKIHRDGNHRAELPDIQGLAGSIRRRGQQTPVKVMLRDKTMAPEQADGSTEYELVFGFRRFAALEHLARGSEQFIRAEVVGWMTPPEVEAERATENLQREDLTPMEEAEAVAAVAEAVEADLKSRPLIDRDADDEEAAGCAGGVPGRVITAVAERLGRSRPWVRDRIYLTRLSGTARKLVAEGRLPLGHARVIATVVDPTLRDSIAARAAQSEFGHGGMSLRILENMVRQTRYRLAVVPWELDVAFAGKPACTECPHNSANDRNLFEGEAPRKGADDEAMCLNKKCFDAKSRATHAAIKKAVERIAEQDAKKPEAERRRGVKAEVGDRRPEAAKMSRFLAEARRVLGGKRPEPGTDEAKTSKTVAKAANAAATDAGKKKTEATARRDREERIRKLRDYREGKWLGRAEDLWQEHIRAEPGLAAMLNIVSLCGGVAWEPWNYDKDAKVWREYDAKLDAIAQACRAVVGHSLPEPWLGFFLKIAELAGAYKPKEKAPWFVDDLCELTTQMDYRLLRMLVPEIEPPPTRESIAAELDAEETAKPESAPKPAATEKKRTRKTKKVKATAETRASLTVTTDGGKRSVSGYRVLTSEQSDRQRELAEWSLDTLGGGGHPTPEACYAAAFGAGEDRPPWIPGDGPGWFILELSGNGTPVYVAAWFIDKETRG